MIDQTLFKYVEQLYILESEQYTLTQIANKLKSEYRLAKNQLQKEQPLMTDNYAQTINFEANGYEKALVGLGICLIIISILAFFYGLSIYKEYDRSSNLFSFIATFMMLIIGIILYKFGVRTKDSRIKEAKKRAYEHTETQLNNIKKHNDEVKLHNNQINKVCESLEKDIKEISAQQASKINLLQRLYDYDIIHKNYRNFYGISKIYYLLDTGICNSLTGVDGAYSQMRLDKIIENQEISIQLQEKLLSVNQAMYNAISETNHLVDTLGQQIEVQNNSNVQLLNDIKNNTSISNFLIESGNNDRKALAASAEYLSYAQKQKRLAEGHIYRD